MTPGRAAVLLLIAALPLSAQAPPLQFANGPAKWLFTNEDQRAWRDVKTDDQAIDFIDLFWARRDPTPGTPRNENRLEFEARAKYADDNFAQPGLRGSMTEMGRVFILLGPPTEMGHKNVSDTGQMAADTQSMAINGAGADPSGGRQLAAKDTWTYTHAQAVKFGIPKLEVVWIYDRLGGLARRDPQRTDFTMALPGAIKSWIVSPDLKSVPEWASSRVKREVITGSETVTETSLVTVPGPKLVETTKPLAKPAGAGKLTLVADPMSLHPQSGGDPFASANSLEKFKRSQDLGWAAEYCSGEVLANAPSVKVQIKIEGKDGAVSSDPEEFVPDSIKASAGCYLVRGSVPLADIEPGPHTLTVTLGAGERKYNLTREVTIE